MRELLGRIFSRVSVLALAVAGAIAGALGYLTQQLVLVADHRPVDPARRAAGPDRRCTTCGASGRAGLEEGLAKADEEERHAQSQADRRGSARCGEVPRGRRRHQEATSAAAAGVYELPWVLFIGDDGRGQEHAPRRVRARPACAVRAPRLRPDRHDRVRARERADRPRHEQPLPDLPQEQDTREWQRLLALLAPAPTRLPDRDGRVRDLDRRAAARQPAELEELARALRLRLNEIRVRLRVDVPGLHRR